MLVRFIGFFLFFLPFQFALNPTPDVDLALVRIWALAIFFWWLARGLAKKSLTLPPVFFTASIFSFLFLVTLSLFWAENTNFALRKILFLLNFFPFIFLFYDLAQEKGVIQRWLKALLMGASLSGGFAILIFLSQFVFGVDKSFAWLSLNILPSFLGTNLGGAVNAFPSLLVNIGGATVLRATALFPDPHVAAYYFGISGLLAFGMFLQEKRKIFLFGASLLIIADLLTFSRGGYLGLAAGGFIFLVLSWKDMSPQRKKNTLLFLGMTLILLFVFGQGILSRFASSFSLGDTSSTDRIVLWQTAIENIKERPLFGTGLGNYTLAVDPTISYRTPYYAHNLYLDIAAELGLLGLFFFLLMIGFAYSQILKNLKTSRPNFLLVAALSGLTLYLVHSLFETALYSVHILPLLLFILGIAYHRGNMYVEKK